MRRIISEDLMYNNMATIVDDTCNLLRKENVSVL